LNKKLLLSLIYLEVLDMDKKKKQLILFVGAIFVAVIFLSSYLSFSNNNSSSTTSTIAKNQTTFYATGTANGIIVNYSYVALVYPKNSSNATGAALTNELSNLEANGTVQDYIYQNGSYQVILSSLSAYDLQRILQNTSGLGNTTVGSSAKVELPASLTLHYTTYPINVQLSTRNYSVYIRDVKSPGTTITLQISALLTQNGAVYQNQLRISYQPG